MAVEMVDPWEGGGSDTTTITPVEHKATIHNFVYLPDKHVYKGENDILCSGKVPTYNLSRNFVTENEYAYLANVTTASFMPRIGEIYANSGSHAFDFFSVFKLSEPSDTVDDTNAGLNGPSFPVWQSIQCSDFEIYVEDELQNKVPLEKVGFYTESNAFGEYDYSAEEKRDKVLGFIGDALESAVELIPYVGGLVSKVLFSAEPTTGIDMQHIGIEQKYHHEKGVARIKFSWGYFDGYEQTQAGFRQELCFGVRISFFTPPKPGDYHLVFKQRVYVDPSSYCTPPLNDTEYKWALGETEGNMWMRKFEIRFPVRFVAEDVQAIPLEAGGPEIAPQPALRYVLNTHTREAHDTVAAKPACNLGAITDAHKQYLETLADVEKFIETEGYNGCHHCMPQYDSSPVSEPEPLSPAQPEPDPVTDDSTPAERPPLETSPEFPEQPVKPSPIIKPGPER